jgi:hypothetical protein
MIENYCLVKSIISNKEKDQYKERNSACLEELEVM